MRRCLRGVMTRLTRTGLLHASLGNQETTHGRMLVDDVTRTFLCWFHHTHGYCWDSTAGTDVTVSTAALLMLINPAAAYFIMLLHRAARIAWRASCVGAPVLQRTNYTRMAADASVTEDAAYTIETRSNFWFFLWCVLACRAVTGGGGGSGDAAASSRV